MNILCEIAPKVYSDYITTNKKGEKITGTVYEGAVREHDSFGTVLHETGNSFALNPYDPCVANKTLKEES